MCLEAFLEQVRQRLSEAGIADLTRRQELNWPTSGDCSEWFSILAFVFALSYSPADQ